MNPNFHLKQNSIRDFKEFIIFELHFCGEPLYLVSLTLSSLNDHFQWYVPMMTNPSHRGSHG